MKMPQEVYLNETFGYAIEAGGFTPPEYKHKYVIFSQLSASDALHIETLRQLKALHCGVVKFIKRHENDSGEASQSVDELKFLLDDIVI
jgi:hypothetical protein